eukprot:14533296-Alexandrium_andersonii.AAC.1
MSLLDALLSPMFNGADCARSVDLAGVVPATLFEQPRAEALGVRVLGWAVALDGLFHADGPCG